MTRDIRLKIAWVHTNPDGLSMRAWVSKQIEENTWYAYECELWLSRNELQPLRFKVAFLTSAILVMLGAIVCIAAKVFL